MIFESSIQPVSLWRRTEHTAREIVTRFDADGCMKEAAALTYTTLFAVVPLMTVTYATLSIVPDFREVGTLLEGYIFRNFVPVVGSELLTRLREFSEQARGLTALGFGFLLVTAYLLLINIERTLNQIWRAPSERTGTRRFLLYWSVLTFGTPALAAVTAISSYLFSSPLLDVVDPGGFRQWLLEASPWMLSGIGFTFLFYAVPNCPVKFWHAFAGGVLVTLLFRLAITGFAMLVSGTNMQVVYGTFAVVPLFLSWIYLCWTLILGGAVFVKVLGEPWPPSGRGDVPGVVGVLRLLRELHQSHRSGGAVPQGFVAQWTNEVRDGDDLIGRLVRAGWITETRDGDWVLARDMATITLWDVCQTVAIDIGQPVDPLRSFAPELAQYLDDAVDVARQRLARPVEEIVGSNWRL